MTAHPCHQYQSNWYPWFFVRLKMNDKKKEKKGTKIDQDWSFSLIAENSAKVHHHNSFFTCNPQDLLGPVWWAPKAITTPYSLCYPPWAGASRMISTIFVRRFVFEITSANLMFYSIVDRWIIITSVVLWYEAYRKTPHLINRTNKFPYHASYSSHYYY